MSDYETQTESTEVPHIPVFQQLGILGAILLLIFGTALIPEPGSFLPGIATPPQERKEQPPIAATELVDYFADVVVTGQSAFVWDVQKQQMLFQKNPDEQLPIASITKLMTALVAYELISENDRVIITDLDLQQDGDSGLLRDESFVLGDLLDLTLISSSNDGAFAIASAAGAALSSENPADTFVRAMNIRAEEIGLTQTFFRNPTGLDISTEEGGAYGSARDITFLMEYILQNHPEILEETQEQFAAIRNTQGMTHSVENTNPTIDRIDGLIGSKTGYTDLAGGNLTIAFDAAFNRPVIVVVLGSTRSERFSDVVALAERARSSVNQ